MKPLAIASCALLLVLSPAAAQTDQQQNPDQPALSDNCRAQTDQGGKQKPDSDNLSDKLDDCGGVLKPPPTGDQGMAAPAPDEGKTPVIKPGEVPAQPPKQ